MDLDNFLDQEYEDLNNAILRAIVNSEEVQVILARFKKQNEIDDKAVLNLFLSLEELHEMINEKTPDSVTYKLEPRTHKKSIKKEEITSLGEKSIISGEELTRNEVLFEKFYQRMFNESKWMKKAGIRF